MAAKEYGYCDHCNGNHARRNEASRELTQAQRDERRAEEVAALSDAAVSLLTSQQVAVSVSFNSYERILSFTELTSDTPQNEYDRRLEEAVQGNFAMSSIQGKLRNAFWCVASHRYSSLPKALTIFQLRQGCTWPRSGSFVKFSSCETCSN